MHTYQCAEPLTTWLYRHGSLLLKKFDMAIPKRQSSLSNPLSTKQAQEQEQQEEQSQEQRTKNKKNKKNNKICLLVVLVVKCGPKMESDQFPFSESKKADNNHNNEQKQKQPNRWTWLCCSLRRPAHRRLMCSLQCTKAAWR